MPWSSSTGRRQVERVGLLQPAQLDVSALAGGAEAGVVEGRVAGGDEESGPHRPHPLPSPVGRERGSPGPDGVEHRLELVGRHERVAAEGRFEVVQDDQRRALAQQAGHALDRVARADGEIRVAADRLAHPGAELAERAAVLEGDEGGAAGEAPGAVEPAPGLGGQRRLAHAAEAVQHHHRLVGQGALQAEQLAGAAVEAVQRLGGQPAGDVGVGQGMGETYPQVPP
jgi:hypothetical protein